MFLSFKHFIEYASHHWRTGKILKNNSATFDPVFYQIEIYIDMFGPLIQIDIIFDCHASFILNPHVTDNSLTHWCYLQRKFLKPHILKRRERENKKLSLNDLLRLKVPILAAPASFYNLQ